MSLEKIFLDERKFVHARKQTQHRLRFLWKDEICRHGIFGRVIVDGGGENKGKVIESTQRLGV